MEHRICYYAPTLSSLVFGVHIYAHLNIQYNYDSQYIAAVPHKYHVRIFTLAIWRTELLIVVIRIHRPRRFKCLLVQALSHPLTVEHNR